MAARFVPNPAGIAALGHTAQMAAFLQGLVDAAENIARAQAPVLTGAYASSFRAELTEVAGRVAARLVNDDPKALWIEFGTGPPGPTPAFQVIRRALESSGLVVGPAIG